MFLAAVALLLVTIICGPILLAQNVAREVRLQRTLSPADRAERNAKQWRKTGRQLGLILFWIWCLVCGAVLAICLYATTQSN